MHRAKGGAQGRKKRGVERNAQEKNPGKTKYSFSLNHQGLQQTSVSFQCGEYQMHIRYEVNLAGMRSEWSIIIVFKDCTCDHKTLTHNIWPRLWKMVTSESALQGFLLFLADRKCGDYFEKTAESSFGHERELVPSDTACTDIWSVVDHVSHAALIRSSSICHSHLSLQKCTL